LKQFLREEISKYIPAWKNYVDEKLDGFDGQVVQAQVNALQAEVDVLQADFVALPPITYQQDFLNTNSIVVVHNMQKKPSVYIEDTGGNVWVPRKINHTTLNTLNIQLDTVFSGTVFLS
jgi:hypothetical protein